MIRFWFIRLWLAMVFIAGCQFASPSPPVQGTPDAVNPTPTAPLVPLAPTVSVEPTPSVVEVRIWGPLELSPQADGEVGLVYDRQRLTYENEHPNTLLTFEPKTAGEAGGLLEYLRSASAVAPAILPDVIIFPTGQLEELASSQLLVPLDNAIGDDLRDALYPFALRDSQIGGSWVAIPLTLQIEHGVRRSDFTRPLPTDIADLSVADAPRWLFAGQGYGDGEMSNALLLQLLAIDQTLPTPTQLPDPSRLADTIAALERAADGGAIPRTVLTLNDEIVLYRRLANRQADWIQSNSRSFLAAQPQENNLTFTTVPTTDGNVVTIAEGYMIAITATTPRRQEAAAAWIQWLYEPNRLGEWNRVTYGLPATREGVAETLEDAAYQDFANALLEKAWLRPSGIAWRDFAQGVQEQFRALLQEQITTDEFIENLQ